MSRKEERKEQAVPGTGGFTKISAAVAAICAMTVTASATLIYDFQDSTLGVDSDDVGFTASAALTEAGLGSTIYGRLTSGSASPADTTVIRGYRPDSVANSTTPDSSSADYVQFTLTPDSGQQLNFASANMSFSFGGLVSAPAGGGIGLWVQPMYRVNAGSFVNLGGVLSVTTAASGSTTFNAQSGFSSGGDLWTLAQASSGAIGLSGITGLAADDTVTFRIAMGDNSSYSTSLGSDDTKAVFFDDIQIGGATVVPEPASIGLIFLSILLLRLRLGRKVSTLK